MRADTLDHVSQLLILEKKLNVSLKFPSLSGIFTREMERKCVAGTISQQGWHSRVDNLLRPHYHINIRPAYRVVPDISRHGGEFFLLLSTLQTTGSATMSYYSRQQCRVECE